MCSTEIQYITYLDINVIKNAVSNALRFRDQVNLYIYSSLYIIQIIITYMIM